MPPRRLFSPDARAYGEFLSRYRWTHFCTLTSHPTTAERLSGVFTDQFIRKLAWEARGRVPWFYATERSSAGASHLHALVGGTSGLRVERVEKCWPLGFTRVRVYEPARAAAFYVAKELDLDPHGWNLSRRMPPFVRGAERAA